MPDPVTDYTAGDEPVPVGTIIEYFGSHAHGEYEVTALKDPFTHPFLRDMSSDELRTAYPDGVAYDIWRVGVSRKFGNRHHSVGFVRRTSFRIKPPGGP